MAEIQLLGPDTWREFIESPRVAHLVIGKNDCVSCNAWDEELREFLAGEHGFENVRFGKIDLKTRGLIEFKRENQWIAELDTLPFNVIYKDGKRERDFAGLGVDRLTNRLKRVLGED